MAGWPRWNQVRADAPGLSVVARTDVAAGRPAVVHLERADIGPDERKRARLRCRSATVTPTA